MPLRHAADVELPYCDATSPAADAAARYVCHDARCYMMRRVATALRRCFFR